MCQSGRGLVSAGARTLYGHVTVILHSDGWTLNHMNTDTQCVRRRRAGTVNLTAVCFHV